MELNIRNVREHAVISTKLLAGHTVVHVHDEGSPAGRREPVKRDLEDVYFTTTAGRIGRRVETVEAA